MLIDLETLEFLRGAYCVAYELGTTACTRILAFLHSKDHGAGDGFPQLLRVLGHAVRSYAGFAAANPQPMVFLLLAVAGLFVLYENCQPQHLTA
jgi:hypothetical protein